MIEEVTPSEAWQALNEDATSVLLDVRSQMEYEYVGHVPASVLVALKEPPRWQSDPNFVDKVRQALEHSRPGQAPEELTIYTLCRSGARSMVAAQELASKGFNKVYNVKEGFEGDKDEQQHRGTLNGWRFHGLPWQQT